MSTLQNKKSRLIQQISTEEMRTSLAVAKKYRSLRKTYGKESIKTNDNTGSFWDNKFISKNSSPNFVERDRNIAAAALFHKVLNPNDITLNIGCGDGKLEEVIGKIPETVQYEGMDFATKSIKNLNLRFKNYHFWVGDITKTRLPKSRYSIISAHEVFEHILDSKIFSVLININKALKPKGYLFVSVPLNEPLLDMFPSNPNEHVRLYSRETVIAELELAGFKIISFEEFIAFRSHYFLKKMIARYLFPNRWKPNDILILAQKK